MYQTMRLLRRRLKQYAIASFLRRNSVRSEGLPSFDGPWPSITNKGDMSIGANCQFRSFRLRQHITVRKNATLKIGHNSYLNDGVNICSTESIVIGHNAKIGDMTYIYDTDFHEVSPDTPTRRAPVCIGNNVWIGAQSIVLAGSTIGDHCVIGAGSVVTGKIPAKSLAVGSPARVVKTLEIPDDSWVR